MAICVESRHIKFTKSPDSEIHQQYQIKPECDTQTNRWTIATVLLGHTNIHHALDITLALAPRAMRWPVALGVWVHQHPGNVDLDAAVLWMPWKHRGSMKAVTEVSVLCIDGSVSGSCGGPVSWHFGNIKSL